MGKADGVLGSQLRPVKAIHDMNKQIENLCLILALSLLLCHSAFQINKIFKKEKKKRVTNIASSIELLDNDHTGAEVVSYISSSPCTCSVLLLCKGILDLALPAAPRQSSQLPLILSTWGHFCPGEPKALGHSSWRPPWFPFHLPYQVRVMKTRVLLSATLPTGI